MNRESLERISDHCQSHIDGFDVSGFKYKTGNGALCWHVTVVDDEQTMHEYWNTEGAFQEVLSTHVFDPQNEQGMTFEIGPVVDPSSGIRTVVAKAIHAWDVEIAG